jgi:hypothetical protein
LIFHIHDNLWLITIQESFIGHILSLPF